MDDSVIKVGQNFLTVILSSLNMDLTFRSFQMRLEPADYILLANNQADDNHKARNQLEVVGVHSDVVAVAAGKEHEGAVEN